MRAYSMDLREKIVASVKQINVVLIRIVVKLSSEGSACWQALLCLFKFCRAFASCRRRIRTFTN